MKSIFLFVVLCLFASPCLALSEAEYLEMKSQSYEFDQADKELTLLWKRIMKLAKGSWKKELIKQQREWVNYGRDKDAVEFMNVGLGRIFSYTRATIKRTHELQAEEYNLNLPQWKIDKGLVKADSFFLTEEDDPSYYAK